MERDVVFGYQRFDERVGTYVRPGVEAGYLAGEGGARHPITIGAFTYRIAGRKGHVVNWLTRFGTQEIRVDHAAAFHGKLFTLVLHSPEKKLSELVSEATGKLAGHFMPHGAVGELWDAREKLLSTHGALVGAGDAWEDRAERGSGALGGTVKHYMMPGMTAPKILDITLGVSRTEEAAALKVVRTPFDSMSFSSVAAFMFGS